jgi:hypothetical protein
VHWIEENAFFSKCMRGSLLSLGVSQWLNFSNVDFFLFFFFLSFFSLKGEGRGEEEERRRLKLRSL